MNITYVICGCLGEMLDGECGEACNTPLHQAFYNKNYKMMFELVRAGADPSCTDNYVFSTLHYAALDNNIEAVQAVVEGAGEGGEEAEGKLQEARETTDFNGFLPAMDTENVEIIKVSISQLKGNKSFAIILVINQSSVVDMRMKLESI